MNEILHNDWPIFLHGWKARIDGFQMNPLSSSLDEYSKTLKMAGYVTFDNVNMVTRRGLWQRQSGAKYLHQ